MIAAFPLLLLGVAGVTSQAFAWGYWNDGGGGGGDYWGHGGYENSFLQNFYPQPGPGAYENGYSAGISDAVYDHDNGLVYNPVGQCLPCHSQVYWDGFHHGYDTQWNSYQVQTQNTDQRVNNYIQVWGNNNSVKTETGQSSKQGQDQNPPIPGRVRIGG
jgi:hypothetical protein